MNRRRFLAGTTLPLGMAFTGCFAAGEDSSPSQTATPTCPSSIPTFERADYEGEVQLVCNHAATEATTAETTLVPEPRTGSLPEAEVTFTFTNRRDQHYNTNTYGWAIQKYVAGEWRLAVPTRVSSDDSSLASGESHMWTITFTSSTEDPDLPLEPVEGNKSITVRGLDSGTYAFHIYGSYGKQGEIAEANTPIVTYAAQFSLKRN